VTSSDATTEYPTGDTDGLTTDAGWPELADALTDLVTAIRAAIGADQ
jgi:hypothetical protein